MEHCSLLNQLFNRLMWAQFQYQVYALPIFEPLLKLANVRVFNPSVYPEFIHELLFVTRSGQPLLLYNLASVEFLCPCVHHLPTFAKSALPEHILYFVLNFFETASWKFFFLSDQVRFTLKVTRFLTDRVSTSTRISLLMMMMIMIF